MWLLTIILWGGTGGVTAFTKELPTEQLCHKVGASYHTMGGAGWDGKLIKVQYQCIKLDK